MDAYTILPFSKFWYTQIPPKNGCGLFYMLLYDNYTAKYDQNQLLAHISYMNKITKMVPGSKH